MKIIDAKITGAEGLPINIDISFEEDNVKKPVVIFCHGFKGFKNWGAWDLVAKKFAKENFIFVKFNFSHNGTSENNLKDFVNLEAFSKNNYSKELYDLEKVLEWIKSQAFPLKNKINRKIFLIGHSRGGGAVLVKGKEEKEVSKICTWASIDTFDRFGTKEQIKQWEKDGEHIFINGRTGQKMPIGYQFYEDYCKNKTRLSIEKAVKENPKPILIIHSTDDPAVSFESAKNIFRWAVDGELLAIENSDHVFNSKHPFLKKEIPQKLDLVVQKTIDFFH